MTGVVLLRCGFDLRARFSRAIPRSLFEEVRDMRCSPMAVVIVTATFLNCFVATSRTVAKSPDRSDAGAATYERLATTIIAVRETENTLVSEILNNYRQLADDQLRAAQDDATNRAARMEAAAEEVTNIANEGNKSVQAIRQRLAKAGHAHH